MEKQIKLDEKSAQEFVSAASRCNFDIDVFYNRIIIDAKSILGLLSLDLTKTLTVKCYGEDENFNSDRLLPVPSSYIQDKQVEKIQLPQYKK